MILPLDHFDNKFMGQHKIFCFGEFLLRLSPAANGKWLEIGNMPVYPGGAEFNVAAALAAWHREVGYCTAIPDNFLSREVCAYMQKKGIDSGPIRFSGSRTGTYYLPQGTDLKNSGLVYDRANSSFSALLPGMLDWEKLLEGYSWFHFSAISPALSENLAAVCLEALDTARKKGMTVSVDLNYRARLWQYGKKPVDVMPALVNYCDLVMGNIWSAETLLGVEADPRIHEKGRTADYLAHAREGAHIIRSRFPQSRWIAHTFRFDRENGLEYFGSLVSGEGQYVSPEFRTFTVADRVGSGDCFMAGLIYGISKGNNAQDTVDFAASAAFGKFQEIGDITAQDEEMIRARIQKTNP
jgi:2-dehydro-3-deoxygluconokinase